MCLSKIDKKFADNDKVIKGYQIKAKYNDGKYGSVYRFTSFYSDYPSNRIPRKKWVKDKEDDFITSKSDDEYRTGYHIFSNKKGLKRFFSDSIVIQDELEIVFVKVLGRNVTTKGLQSKIGKHSNVYVCREIKILKEIKENAL